MKLKLTTNRQTFVPDIICGLATSAYNFLPRIVHTYLASHSAPVQIGPTVLIQKESSKKKIEIRTAGSGGELYIREPEYESRNYALVVNFCISFFVQFFLKYGMYSYIRPTRSVFRLTQNLSLSQSKWAIFVVSGLLWSNLKLKNDRMKGSFFEH